MNCSRVYKYVRQAALKFIVLALLVVPAAGQSISFGGKFGTAILDPFLLTNASSSVSDYSFSRTRYTLGPTFEIGLPLPYNLTFEADALYKPLKYQSFPFGFNTFQATTEGNSWEFPLLAKGRFLTGIIRPFGDLGVSFRHVGGTTTLSTVSNTTTLSSPTFQTTISPSELVRSWSTGYVAGGGVDFSYGAIHISPEVRYTRWASVNFASGDGVLGSNRNALDILIGVTFTNEHQ